MKPSVIWDGRNGNLNLSKAKRRGLRLRMKMLRGKPQADPVVADRNPYSDRDLRAAWQQGRDGSK